VRISGILRLQLAVAAGDGDELELLVGLAVAGPLVNGRAARGRVPEHVQAQAVVADNQLAVARPEPAPPPEFWMPAWLMTCWAPDGQLVPLTWTLPDRTLLCGEPVAT
jgi:hypothetical protein